MKTVPPDVASGPCPSRMPLFRKRCVALRTTLRQLYCSLIMHNLGLAEIFENFKVLLLSPLSLE